MTAKTASSYKIKHQYSAGFIVWTIFKYFTLILVSFTSVLPIVSCVITAFKSKTEYQNTNVMQLPTVWKFSNFAEAFKMANMGRAFLNSLIILIFVIIGSILLGTSLAFALNRFKFVGNGLIRNLFTFAALLPGIAMQVSTYSIMSSLHLINHLYGYNILMMGTDVISIYIFIQYYENLPISLDESAILDGTNYFQIYWHILLPLLKPAIVTCIILKGANTYNEYYCAHLYLQKPELCTVAISLYTFTGPMGNQYNYICAGVIISLLPALIVFLLCQDQIYNGIAAGAVKG
ncbi:MAG: carbohydrate ABC transporter permease [Eubacterium sp.]|nr:carbohydrate ABC transporter permease [Eubacterium sp.]